MFLSNICFFKNIHEERFLELWVDLTTDNLLGKLTYFMSDMLTFFSWMALKYHEIVAITLYTLVRNFCSLLNGDILFKLKILINYILVSYHGLSGSSCLPLALVMSPLFRDTLYRLSRLLIFCLGLPVSFVSGCPSLLSRIARFCCHSRSLSVS